jgi:cytoskeletal protein RodZ
MSSPPRNREREEERRLSLRTLAIASLASATAAIVTSQFWAGGTPIAAAVTPVLVALVSEMLHRPTEAIARRITSERTAILPEDAAPEPRREQPRRESETEPPVRIYGRERPRRGRRKIAVGVVVTTAVLAFAIAAAALTVPELITGHSIVKSDRNTTLVPTKRKKSKPEEQQTTPTTPEQQSTETTPEQKPEATTTTPTETETTPTETETTPKAQPK